MTTTTQGLHGQGLTLDTAVQADRIIHGDCNAILPSLPDRSVDLVLTDPPYGVSYRDRSGRTVANDSTLENVLGAFPQLYRVLKPDSFCISFYGFFNAVLVKGFIPRPSPSSAVAVEAMDLISGAQ